MKKKKKDKKIAFKVEYYKGEIKYKSTGTLIQLAPALFTVMKDDENFANLIILIAEYYKNQPSPKPKVARADLPL